jgi:uncharacterized membrane protein
MIHYLFSLSGDFATCCVIVMLAALFACVILCIGIAMLSDDDAGRDRCVKYLKRAIIIAAVSGLLAIFVPERDACYEMAGIENPYPIECCEHK